MLTKLAEKDIGVLFCCLVSLQDLQQVWLTLGGDLKILRLKEDLDTRKLMKKIRKSP